MGVEGCRIEGVSDEEQPVPSVQEAKGIRRMPGCEDDLEGALPEIDGVNVTHDMVTVNGSLV